jgi:hypothetical protein
MKTFVTLLIGFVLIFNLATSCEIDPPFKYVSNTRVIFEGRLLDENSQPLPNQQIVLKSEDNGFDIDVTKIKSDADGYFFLTAPNANNGYSIYFKNKDVVSVQNYNGLIFPNGAGGNELRNFKKSTYNFGIIKLIEAE